MLPVVGDTCTFHNVCPSYNDECKGHNVYACVHFHEYTKGPRAEIEVGLLQMQILWLLGIRSSHGYEMMKNLNAMKRTHVKQGTLYPALHRLVKSGLISPEVADRKVVYHLTEKGHKVMEDTCADFCRTFYGIFHDFIDRRFE